MSEVVIVYCDHPHCHHCEYITLEDEQCEAGDEHEYTCPDCGWITRYLVYYKIAALALEACPPLENKHG